MKSANVKNNGATNEKDPQKRLLNLINSGGADLGPNADLSKILYNPKTNERIQKLSKI